MFEIEIQNTILKSKLNIHEIGMILLSSEIERLHKNLGDREPGVKY